MKRWSKEGSTEASTEEGRSGTAEAWCLRWQLRQDRTAAGDEDGSGAASADSLLLLARYEYHVDNGNVVVRCTSYI